jgi:hypothetical protein
VVWQRYGGNGYRNMAGECIKFDRIENQMWSYFSQKTERYHDVGAKKL